MKLLVNLLAPSRQYLPWLPALLATYACAAACSSAPGPAPSQPVGSAPSHSVDSAQKAVLDAPPETFRAFVAPQPLPISAPSDTSVLPMKDTCVQVDRAAFDHERARGVAALDAEMRKDGGFVLATQERFDIDQRSPIGSISRGKQGERLMVVGTYNRCHPPVPYVLSATGEVFPAYITLDGAKSQNIRACSGECYSCGRQAISYPLVAEVPEGSTVVAAKTLTVAIDLALVFDAQNACPKVQ